MRIAPRLAPFVAWMALAGCRDATEPTPPAAPADTKAIDRLLMLMGERLAIMQDVSRWKWNHKVPITDRDRERRVLEAVGERGAAAGLDRDEVTRFYTAQIAAGKLLQQSNFDTWEEGQHVPFAGIAPLAELRERIDALNSQLLESLAATRDVPAQTALDRAETVLRGKGITPAVRAAAMAPWREQGR